MDSAVNSDATGDSETAANLEVTVNLIPDADLETPIEDAATGPKAVVDLAHAVDLDAMVDGDTDTTADSEATATSDAVVDLGSDANRIPMVTQMLPQKRMCRVTRMLRLDWQPLVFLLWT